MNSKIAGICARIDYVIPKGTIDEYKYGVKVVRRSVEAPHESENIIASDVISTTTKTLREELKAPFKTSGSPLEVDLVK